MAQVRSQSPQATQTTVRLLSPTVRVIDGKVFLRCGLVVRPLLGVPAEDISGAALCTIARQPPGQPSVSDKEGAQDVPGPPLESYPEESGRSTSLL